MSKKILATIKKCLILVIIWVLCTKYYDNSNKLVIGKMKDGTGRVVVKEFVRLKLKLYSCLVGNSEHKKTKGMNKNVVATIIHNE